MWFSWGVVFTLIARASITEDDILGGSGLHVPPFSSCSFPTTPAPSSNPRNPSHEATRTPVVSLCTPRSVATQNQEVAPMTLADVVCHEHLALLELVFDQAFYLLLEDSMTGASPAKLRGLTPCLTGTTLWHPQYQDEAASLAVAQNLTRE